MFFGSFEPFSILLHFLKSGSFLITFVKKKNWDYSIINTGNSCNRELTFTEHIAVFEFAHLFDYIFVIVKFYDRSNLLRKIHIKAQNL